MSESSAVTRPLHLRRSAVALVMAGGVLGAAAREAIEQARKPAGDGFPVGTFVINLAGAFVLGVLLEALVRTGPDQGWRRRARILGGTGFCGGFTTYSTLAVETVQLARHGAWGVAAVYIVATVAGGILLVGLGLALAGGSVRGSAAGLPLDPDIDPLSAGEVRTANTVRPAHTARTTNPPAGGPGPNGDERPQ